ncbi:leucine-rich repeat domain-containing protein [Alloprevotella sp. OH1205_COT-284]|uniref:leucine-rich repeat domain-containing protein n=1 Tax=Alloprevotella sp. OH1205_COT-284 TaxID=2491043 RepID=UPI000F5D5CFF|nr:leucine-rich repeat domain-containing protein [Alloprevotella sp. OH1205_COT-284]RRD79689.1 leucine-rich repeat domain-containing protein [Alloprevotella sp. OH1205_COT-284]
MNIYTLFSRSLSVLIVSFGLCVLIPQTAVAQTETQIGRITYKLNEATKTAAVKSGDPTFNGEETIPATIQHNGKNYKVTSIENEAFQRYKAIGFSLPEGLETIGKNAFDKCWGLTKISFPSTLTTIEEAAFSGCINLQDVYFPNEGLTNLNASVFAGCTGLYKISLPASLKYLGRFVFNYCNKLKKIECRSKVAPNTETDFSFPSNVYDIYVPQDATGYDNRWSNGFGELPQKVLSVFKLTIPDFGHATFNWDKKYCLPKGVVAGTVTVSGRKATVDYVFNSGNGAIKANTPLLLKGAPGTYEVVESKLLLDNTTDVSGNLLRGTEGLTQSTGSTRYYVLTKKNGKFGFYYQNGTDGTSVNNAPNRCFLEVNTSSPVQGFSLDDNLTGISEIKNDIEADPTAPVYDLSGRRTTSKQRGIYIVNGKRIIR